MLSVDVGAKFLGVLVLAEVLSLALVAVVILAQGGGPEGLGFAASFAPDNIFTGGFAGSAGIALTFAFASYIGFEATANYGEETRDPKRTVPIATYLAVGLIAVLFAVTSWAMVSGLGSSHVIDRVTELSTVNNVPLSDPAAVLFAVAEEYVGGWLATLMRLAGAFESVRRAARVSEQRGPLLLLHGPHRRAPTAARPRER